MVTLNKAAITDAARLVELSRDIYKEHYLHLWHPGGAEWYMEDYAYDAEKIKNELADSYIEYFMAVEDGSLLGYMKLVLSARLAGYEDLSALEVERIYLYKKTMGKGIGKQMMNLAGQRAIELKKDIIFLKAMDSSTDAIRFYKKLGYTACGNLQLPMPAFSLMKEEYRGMVILKKEVDRLQIPQIH